MSNVRAAGGVVARHDRHTFSHRDGVGFYDVIVFTFHDDTAITAGLCAKGWMLSSGDGWYHVRDLVNVGWVDAIDRGPDTYGHTDYIVRPEFAADMVPGVTL